MLEVWTEIGSLWDGNPSLAYRMIREAAQAGANVVKCQLGHDPADPIRGASDKHAEFLRDAVHEYGMKFAASFFSLAGLNTGRRVGLDYYKIPSQKTYSDSVLVAEALKDQKPTYVSHGMGSVDSWLTLAHSVTSWPEPSYIKHVWCLSEYPTYVKRLRQMPFHFQGREPFMYYGYSDHVHGLAGCLLAIARGARMVEVHFTLNPTNQNIRDHSFAKTPDELAELVRLGRDLHRVVEAAG